MQAAGSIIINGIIDGEDGKGITTADVMFCIISGTGTPADSANWRTTVAQLSLSDSTKEYYLWQATYITYTDGTHAYTGKVCLGQVKDFASVTEQYAHGTASAATSNWQDNTPPAPQKGSYLWTRTKLVFANGSISYQPSEAGYCLGYYGEDGTSPWIADLSNEMDSVACDLTGKPTGQQEVSTVISLFYGSSPKPFGAPVVTRNGVEVTLNAAAYTNGVKVTYSGGTLTVSYNTDAVISATDKFVISITSTEDPSVVRQLTFTVNGVRPGSNGQPATTYSLVPSVSEIVRKKDGTYSPASLSCYCTSLTNGIATDDPSAATMQYSFNNSSWSTFTSSAVWQSANVYNNGGKLYLRLLVDGKVMDKETIPVVTEGTDGTSAPYVELSRTAILYHANDQGQSVEAQSFGVDCYLKVNGNACSISSVDDISVGTISGVMVTKNSTSRITLQVTHSQVIQGVVSVEMTGTYDGKAYTAKASITVEPNRDGQEGQPGANAPYNVYTYGRSKTRTDYSGANFDDQTGWVSVAPAPNDTYPYIWQRIQYYSGDGELLNTSYICLTGAVGGVGATGKMCYIAGEYDPARTYTSNSQQTVAVEVPVSGSNDVELYYLAAATNVVDGAHIAPTDAGQAVWQKGLNNYNLIRTKYLFADFAHLGSAIITGDWLISACGTIGGTAYNTTDINHPATYTHNGEEKAAYMWFDPVHPNDDVTHNFIPNFAVDLLTGRSYQNEAYIRGEVHATSGDFENVKISGGIRSPFTFVGEDGTFGTDLSEHMSILTFVTDPDTYTGTLYNLPWDVLQSGRRITIVNYKWGNFATTNGYAKISVPSQSQFFFEDGYEKNSLVVASGEAVEILGYGDENNFFGWIVINRFDISANLSYGHPQNVLAKGIVTGGTTPSVRGYTYKGIQMQVSRISQGKYRLYTSDRHFSHNGGLMALATGMGLVNSKPVAASVSGIEGQTVVICTFTSDGLVDGNFTFMIMNADDVAHLAL